MKKILLLTLLPFVGLSQTQIGLDINGTSTGDNAGGSVAISANGTIVAVGSSLSDVNGTDSGVVRVYQNLAGAWVENGISIIGEAPGDLSGSSVALSADGTTIAIGATHNNFNTGHVRVYKNMPGGFWTQQGADINGLAYGDAAGWSVSLSADGTTVAIGSPYNTINGNDSGIVRVYKNVAGAWSQIGANIDGWFYDAFGRSVSLSADGNTVAIGSPYNSMNGGYAGRVRVYSNVAGTWTQQGIDIRGNSANEISGYSISLSADGSTVAVGAIGNSSMANAGYVKIFKNIAGNWTQQGSTINGEATGDSSGRSISMSADGTIVAIGATLNAGNGTGSGHVRIYKLTSGVWQQLGVDLNGQAAGDNCGMSVALSADGNTLIIGSPKNGANGVNAGQARVYDISQLLSSTGFVWENFSVYPNPATETLNVQLEQNIVLERITLYNQLGQFVRKSTTSSMGVADVAKGVYFVEVVTDQGKATKSIIIK